jgi:HSP20 family protein
MAIDRTREEKGPLARVEPGILSSPFSMMRRLSDDMERIFEDTWGTRQFPRLFRGLELAETKWTPDIEAFERQGEFVVRADLPGMTKDNVTVEVLDNQLVIKGERKEEKEQKEKGYYASERSYGAFYRALPLPEGVKSDEAKATFKDGVLEIAMPAGKAPEKHGRQLEIK